MMADQGLEPIRSAESLADAAYAQLSEAILFNRLPAGSSLSVPELSERLGISRSPAREAVQRLIHDGLAEYRGRRGTVVSSTTGTEFAALLEVRGVLEGLSARSAALAGSVSARTELGELHDQLCSILIGDTHSETDLVDLDMAFHRLIRRMSGNLELTVLLDRIQARSHLSMHTLWQGARNLEAVVAEHAAICGAIVAGEPEVAEDAARTHIALLRGRVLSTIEAEEAVRSDEMPTEGAR